MASTASTSAGHPAARPAVPAWFGVLARVAVVAAFIGSIAFVLAAEVPDIVDTPLVSDDLGWTPTSVPLTERSRDGSRKTAGLTLRLRSVETLLVHPEIRLLFATYAERATLIDATLRVASFGCAYRPPPGARLVNNQYMRFVRDADCRHGSGSGPTDLDLSLTFSGAQRAAVWTYQPPEGEEPSAPDIVVAVGEGGPTLVVRGRYVDYRNQVSLRRIDLLAYMWQVSESPAWLWVALAVAAGLLLAGSFLFPMRAFAPGDRLVLRSVGGAFCFAAALGVLYAVLVPPFQAPDEPDHFVSYLNRAGATELVKESEEWARRSHFARIAFHGDEKFHPVNVPSPWGVGWPPYVDPTIRDFRSPTTTLLWSQLGNTLFSGPVSWVLVATRLLNASVYASAVGLGVCLILMTGVGPYRQLAVVPFLIVPTLPFFGMMMSDFAILTSAYVLLSCCLVALFLDGPRSHVLGLALGVSVAVVFASGRNAGPLGILVAAALGARVLLGTRGRGSLTDYVRNAAVFWGGLGAGVLAFSLLTTPEHLETLKAIPAGTMTALNLLYAVVDQPLWLLPLFSAAVIVEVILRAVSRAAESPRAHGASWWLALLVHGVAAAMVLEVALSVFVPFPHLATREASLPPDALSYVTQVLTVFGTSLRIGPPDHLLVASFWGGFGWIDTLPPPFLATALVLLTGLAVSILLVYLGRTRDTRRIVWLLLTAAGWIGALAAYAAVGYAMHFNLHGRYLIGFYVTLISVAWSSAVLVPELPVWPRRVPQWLSVQRTIPLLLLSATVHAYCLRIILTRYF